jgi:hypothetical protein
MVKEMNECSKEHNEVARWRFIHRKENARGAE